MEKTKEIVVVDFRRAATLDSPLTIYGATMERVSSTKFLCVHLAEDLILSINTASLAINQQSLHFLRRLRRARAPVPIMSTFYRGTTKSILTITVWYGGCTASCQKTLQRIVRAAQKTSSVPLFPPSRTPTTPAWPAKHSPLRVTPPIPSTASSVPCPPRGA